MNRSRFPLTTRGIAASAALAVALPGALAAQAAKFDSPVVSTQWLAEHLNDPSVVVLHLANIRRDYTAGHVPGARFLWVNDIAPGTPDLSTELPPVAKLDSLMESLGVSDNSRVVVYAPTVSTMAARVFMTLDYLGLGDRAAVLDGGFNAWKAEGREVSTEVPKVVKGKFTPRVRAEAVVNAEGVKASIDKPGVRILDARTPDFYGATTTGPAAGGTHPERAQYSIHDADRLDRPAEGSGDDHRDVHGRGGSTVRPRHHVLPRRSTGKPAPAGGSLCGADHELVRRVVRGLERAWRRLSGGGSGEEIVQGPRISHISCTMSRREWHRSAATGTAN